MKGERMPPSAVQALLLCPISCDVMEDPVMLLPAGMTYDRKQICASLLHHPNLDPSSGLRYESKLQYCDNVAMRQLLMETYGDKAYRKYDDSGFQTSYQEAWNAGKFVGRVAARINNVETCERLSPLLWGMNLSQVNLKAAFVLVETFPEDAVMVAVKALFLDHKISSTRTEFCCKDLGLARSAWSCALGLGLRDKAISGNAWAQWAEGRRQSFLENYVDAVEWTRKAADQDFAAAQYSLGVMYTFGKGVTQSYSLATKWFHKAAVQGFVAAQCSLGVIYAHGMGVTKQSSSLAVDWYRKAAVQGYSVAQYKLGGQYLNGLGVEKNYSLAAEWWRKAAVQGNYEAQSNLGTCYDLAQGLPKSNSLAVEWYRKAAIQGYDTGQYNLGTCYEFGRGLPKSNSFAVHWYRKAAIQGHAPAKDRLQRLLVV
jgi:TPR repeat protein